MITLILSNFSFVMKYIYKKHFVFKYFYFKIWYILTHVWQLFIGHQNVQSIKKPISAIT